MSVRILLTSLAALAMIGLATILVKTEDSEPPPASLPTKSRREAVVPRVTTEDMLRMGPADWRERLKKEAASFDPQTRDDIVQLAGDLQDMLASGTDPRGEDASVYIDAIRELLDYGATSLAEGRSD